MPVPVVPAGGHILGRLVLTVPFLGGLLGVNEPPREFVCFVDAGATTTGRTDGSWPFPHRATVYSSPPGSIPVSLPKRAAGASLPDASRASSAGKTPEASQLCWSSTSTFVKRARQQLDELLVRELAFVKLVLHEVTVLVRSGDE